MKEEKVKDFKFIIVFILIVGFSSIYLAQSSLAKYRKQTSAEIDVNIAKWNIKINNEDIDNKVTLTNKIVPSFTGNEYVKDSVIAPGSVGYCDIIIDATGVDVDFNYELNSIVPEDSDLKDLKITDYIINPTDTNTDVSTYDEVSSITGTIQKNTDNYVIRLYIKWDEETGTMDNKQDTDVAINPDSKALIKAILKFQQKI